ncbi:MAG: asparagine synthase (glutamine-hydrolyzing), partial [Gammaproteobacteria bacterium]
IALGHRRLSIQDLSPAGHQPMESASGRYVVAYNGEIYNHLDLRKELEKPSSGGSGARRWRGHSDTETLLAAIDTWGIETSLKRCVGMFAFALWDRQERVLTLARDRLGEKPLYYGWQGKSFLFGSELKALRQHPEWKNEVNRDVLALFMRHNYVPSPYSIYQGVYKLPPGTMLHLRAGAVPGTIPEPEAYWSATDTVMQGLAHPFTGSEGEAVDALESLLLETIGDKMISDVPLGAFLSGGYDSSLVVALMQARSERPVRTFSIGFHEEGYNEAHHAAAVAAHLGTEHSELYVTPEQAMAVIPDLPRIYDEPFADSSQIPTFLVSRLAREQVTVSLSGDGGDELFGGYNRYAQGRMLMQRLGRLPAP